MAKKIIKEVSLIQYEANELDQATLELIEAAKKSALKAYAPYSNFQVGAALLLSNGKIILGNNQENACYPAGLCAERVAFFSAKSQFPDCQIIKVAIVAKPKNQEQFKMAMPCGSCRQVMSEYENNQEEGIKVYMSSADGRVYESDSIDNFLPFKFSNKDLDS